jgi:Ser/Thr protein kinase RdoA (MazF antagonist)
MEKLRKEGLPVPKTFTTRDGKLVCDYNEKHLVIQEYIEGKIIHKANNAFVRDFAKNIGLVNKSLLRVGLSNKHLWKKIGHQFEPSDYRSSDVIEGFNFVNSENKLLAELNQNVKKDKLRKSIIHADYTLNNLVVNDKKVLGILDWGNLHEDYLVFDTAIAMGHLFFANKLAKKEKIKFFMKEYERHVKLNANEKRAIYYFIKIRLLSGIVWCELQRQKHQDKSKKLTKWLKNTIKNYRDFDNISLKEFLQLL